MLVRLSSRSKGIKLDLCATTIVNFKFVWFTAFKSVNLSILKSGVESTLPKFPSASKVV